MTPDGIFTNAGFHFFGEETLLSSAEGMSKRLVGSATGKRYLHQPVLPA